MNLKSLIEKMDQLTEAAVETPRGKIHRAEPGGYGRKEDDGAPKKAEAPRGRGRPRKDTTPDGEGGPKFSDTAKEFFGIPKKDFDTKKLPGKVSVKHKIKDESIEESTGVTDYSPKSQGGTRKELIAKYKKTKNPKDAEAARKAGATQKELQDADKNVSEATKETTTGKIHKAEPGGYGRKDDEDDEGKKVQAQVKRGRGRPKKGADVSGHVPQYEKAKELQGFMVGNLPGGKLPGKPGKKHKLKDWIEHVEHTMLAEGNKTLGRMHELEDEYSDELNEISLDPSQIALPAVKAPGAPAQPATTSGQPAAGTTAPTTVTQPAAGAAAKPTTGAAVIDFKNPNDPLKSALQQAVKNKQVSVLGEEDEIEERHMTSAEKRKESQLKSKFDDSEMKSSMMKKYGPERGKQIYFATIRKKAMSEAQSHEKSHINESALADLLANYPHEHKAAQEGWGMDESLYEALCEFYFREGRIPRKVWHGPLNELRSCVEGCYAEDTTQPIDEDLFGAAGGALLGGAALGPLGAIGGGLLGGSMTSEDSMEEGALGSALGGVAGGVLGSRAGPAGSALGQAASAAAGSAIQDRMFGTESMDSELERSLDEMFLEMEDDHMNESMLTEKWGTTMKTPAKDKGKWDGYSIAELKARKAKLMKKTERTAAEQKEIKQINFAIRAKHEGGEKWGKVEESSQGVAEGSDQYLVYISKNKVREFEKWMDSEGLETDVPKRDEGTYVVYDYSDADHTSKMYADEWNEKKDVSEGGEGFKQLHPDEHGVEAKYYQPDQYDTSDPRHYDLKSLVRAIAKLRYMENHPSSDGLNDKDSKALQKYEQIFKNQIARTLDYKGKDPNSLFKEILATVRQEEESNKYTDQMNKTLKTAKRGLSGMYEQDAAGGLSMDTQMESWDRELTSLLTEGLTVTTSTGQPGGMDSVSVSATDSDAQTLMQILQRAGITGGSKMGAPHTALQVSDDSVMPTVEPASADEVMGSLQPDDADSGDQELGFLQRMLGARGAKCDTDSTTASDDYAIEESEVEEGNAFTGALAKAKSDGIQPGETMKVGGKEYPVKEESQDGQIADEGKLLDLFKKPSTADRARAEFMKRKQDRDMAARIQQGTHKWDARDTDTTAKRGANEGDEAVDADLAEAGDTGWMKKHTKDPSGKAPHLADLGRREAQQEKKSHDDSKPHPEKEKTQESDSDEHCMECGGYMEEGHACSEDSVEEGKPAGYDDNDDESTLHKPLPGYVAPRSPHPPEEVIHRTKPKPGYSNPKADADVMDYTLGEKVENKDEKLDEWANSPNDSDEQFLADINYMTKIISGGLNNIKQDQTVVPSARVKTQTEIQNPGMSMAEMLKKFENLK